ncbi:MAG: hypothetical protein NZM37_08110 [Sandaracinaceae bacterium]|nr:hypothetical protein [Sandaracinaceae bacterium]MDW8245500.1 hypothetical protein [Sandaracinaceae bacterium]
MRERKQSRFLLFVLAFGCFNFVSPLYAQEIQITGPLAGAPAVRRMRMYRVMRVNVVPGIGYTLQDEFSRSLFVGLEANFHFLDWLGIGIWAGYAAALINTDLTSRVMERGQVTSRNRFSLPDREQFDKQIGRIQWAVSAHLIFIPLRGKLSLFQSVFVDTDLYVLGGAALFGIEERASTTIDESGCGERFDQAKCRESQLARAGRVAPTPMFGVGLSMYVNSWFGLTIEWRGFPFSWNPSGTDEAGPNGPFPDGKIDGTDSRTTFNHMVFGGLAFLLPPDLKISD